MGGKSREEDVSNLRRLGDSGRDCGVSHAGCRGGVALDSARGRAAMSDVADAKPSTTEHFAR